VSGEKHIVEFFHDLARQTGLTQAPPSLPRAYWDEAEEARAEALLADAGVPSRGTAVGLAPGGGSNPGSRQSAKRWPAPRYGELADRVETELGRPVVFLGGAGDRDAVRVARQTCKRPHASIVGVCGLTEMAALMNRLALVVANDSGLMHLSVASDVPTVGIFGPTLPAYCGPYGRRHRVVYEALDCTMCARMTCPTHECMSRITVDDVFETAASALMDGRDDARHPGQELATCSDSKEVTV